MVLEQHTARGVFQEDPFKAETIAAALQLLCSDEQLESLRLNPNFRRGVPNSDKRSKELVRSVRECLKGLFNLVAEPHDHGRLLRPLVQSQWAKQLLGTTDLDKDSLKDVVGQAVCRTYQVCVLYVPVPTPIAWPVCLGSQLTRQPTCNYFLVFPTTEA